MTTRRQFLAGAAAWLPARTMWGAVAPAAPVAVAKCPSYGSELVPAMQKMFDQLGGLERIVKNKTVAMKVNLTGSPTIRLGFHPLEDTTYTHPRVIGAMVHLMGRAGARRIRILESPWSTADPIEEYILQANWEPRDILNAAANVEFENTNWLGNARKYSRFKVPHGGHIYPAFDLNHSYEDCDVFVSAAKMKDHVTAGITLSLKNCFGITPCTIYGEGAGVDEPSILPKGGRGMFHAGNRQPSKSAPAENDPKTPREGGYRVPRIVADINAARPIQLAVIEGVTTMAGGEGPWTGPGLKVVNPGVLVAGTNPVSTDAVAMSVMGYDPMADRGTPPFETCDNTLRLAEELGVGTRDLNRIEVVGTPVAQARFDFGEIRRQRGKRLRRG
jgi:uncharacterized protein (DUF362 family)